MTQDKGQVPEALSYERDFAIMKDDATYLVQTAALAARGFNAQGLRDGVASAGSEPVAWLVCTEDGDPDMVFLSQHDAQQYLEDDERPTPLYTHRQKDPS